MGETQGADNSSMFAKPCLFPQTTKGNLKRNQHPVRFLDHLPLFCHPLYSYLTSYLQTQ